MGTYVDSLDHLELTQKKELLATLKQFPTLFGGGLGELNIDPIRLELKPDAKPYHAKPFGVPKAYLETTKKRDRTIRQIGNLGKSQ